MGRTVNIMGPGDAALFDAAASVEVELFNDSMWLESRTDDALVAGANLAMLGEELIQFGTVNPLGGRRFRLSRLLRGRRGSEWAAGVHGIGERFVLIDPRALLAYDLPGAALGAQVRVMASGVGDAAPAEAGIVAAGRALRPPAPVHLTAIRRGDGTIGFGWTRRSRTGWAWLDGGDAPLGEEGERYRLEITYSSGAARTVETVAPGYDYSPAEQAADGAGSAATFSVVLSQLGSVAPSLPAATATFSL